MNTINDLILQFHLKLLDMIKRKDIFLISLFVSIVAPSLNAEATKLEDGFYFGSTLKDSVDVSSSNENLVIIFSDGSKYSFDRKDKTAFYKKNISNDGETLIQVIDSENFKILHNQNTENIKPYSKYTLYKKPGFLNKVIAALVTSALLFSLFQFYLKLNKVWKRRKISEVANSISIVASLLGFATLVPFLLNSILITADYPSSVKYILGLILAIAFSLISMGYFVDENKGVGFFTLLGRALKTEGQESGDLISDMLRPKGATKIIDILVKLAAIDDDIAKEEIDLINQFASKWDIKIPELKPGKPDQVTNLVELKSLVQSYLDEGPDIEVAEGLVDLINMMAEADDEVTKEEEMAVAEFTGMIAHYVGSEKGGKMNMYEVNIVPQDDKQINAVKEILPELDVVIDRGGKVFKVGRYFSEDYAEAVCEKYITLGLYSVTSKVVVDLSKD
ncbi:MAG: TerB family tellurite resistance protein [Candidatus Marinimicrobia bacterium]|nr:TerB family tellurite resistance protein [Candidatus Neomarinimicrobiota bacterium]